MEMKRGAKEVAVQWEPPEPDPGLDVCPDLDLNHREVGCQCDSAQTRDAGVQVDLISQALSGSSVLLQCVRADGPEGGPLLQHCSQTRTRTRVVRPARRYEDYEAPPSPERKRRKTREEENGETSDPNWTPSEPGAALSQNSVSHDASVVVKLEPGSSSRTRGGVVCDICGKVLKTKSSLSRHTLVHSGSKPHACPHCPMCFNRKDNLRHHLSNLHPDGPAPRIKLRPLATWLCHTCGKTFSCRSRLQAHEVIHSGVKPCACPLCPKAYMRMNDLEHHLKTVHPGGVAEPPPPPSLLCHLCGREFKCKSQLSLHLQQHTGERPYLCHLCGRKFSRKQQLNIHSAAIHRDQDMDQDQDLAGVKENGEQMENGGENNRLVCEVCGRRMKTEALLEAHVRVHSGDQPYRCGLCGKGFQRPTTLKQHQVRVHLRAKPERLCPARSRPCSYPCPVCGRSFRFRSLLEAHSAVHSDARPFPCDLCRRSFRRRSHLKRHRAVVHPDGRPPKSYVCSVCGVDQKYRSRLQRHLLVHSGERPHRCERCGLAFSRLGNLQQHCRRIHGDGTRPRRGGDDEDMPPLCLFNSEEETSTNEMNEEGSEGAEEGSEGMEVGSVGAEVRSVGAEAVSVGAEAGSQGVEAGNKVMEAGSVGAEKGSVGAEKGSVGAEAGSKGVEAGNKVMEARSMGAEEGIEAVVVGRVGAEEGSVGAEAVSVGAEAISAGIDAGNKVMEAGSVGVEAGNKVVETGNDIIKVQSELVETGEVVEAVSEVIVGESDIKEVGNDIKARSEGIEVGVGVLEADHYVIEAESEVTQVEVSSTEYS